MFGPPSAVARRSLVAAALFVAVGWSVAFATTQTFTASGTANVTAAIAAFEAASGGANTAGGPPAAAGFRTINWDGVKLNTTDFPGTRVIVLNKVVGIPVNRFASRGATFAEVYAVSGDDFVSVNPAMSGQFSPFSPNNTFAMFNETSIEMSFNLPGDPLTPAAVRGFGVVFLDVESPNTSGIQFFHGKTSLSHVFAPVASGQPSFVGVLFDTPQVTNVEIIPGTAAIFSFNGTTVTTGPPENLPTTDLAVTDDFVYSEPVANLQAPCVPSDSILCLDDQTGDQRFRVAMTFATAQNGGLSGVGNQIELGSLGVHHGGLFWFFSPDNPELLIKVLNGCALNRRYWVFFSAGTNVGFKLSVIDTVTGLRKDYTNADDTAAPPVQDTAALACPVD